MSHIYTSVEQLVGNTPLLRLTRLEKQQGWQAQVLAKLEYLNPAGSAKDRLALAMINAAEAQGALQPGGTIIEPTSGNTGIGLAMVGAARGYRVILTMPDSMSAERLRGAAGAHAGRAGHAGRCGEGGGASGLHPRQLHPPAV